MDWVVAVSAGETARPKMGRPVLHCSGRASRYVSGPMTLSIVNGPHLRASNFGDGRSVAKSFVSSHT